MERERIQADKPRRPAADPVARPAKRLSTGLRDGIALAVASGLALTVLGAFGLANYPSVAAFASQSSPAPSGIEQAREGDAGRSAKRAAPSFEDLVKQRTQALTQTGDEVEAERYEEAAAARSSQLEKTAASVEDEADRLRNLANFLWPTEGGVGSPWGQRLHPILHYYRLHGGADIGGRCGQPIYAAQSGKVTKAAGGGYNGGSGNNIRIDHGDINGIHVETAYLHMSEIAVKEGQQVTKGDLIGKVGSTGLSTACHLHLSLYKDGVNSDPLEYVKKSEKQDAPEAKVDENSADRELDLADIPQA